MLIMTRYGLYLMNFGETADPKMLTSLAVDAEHAGWDGFFLTDTVMYHKTGEEPLTDVFTVLPAIAVKTSRMRIGTTIAALPRRSPWQVARQTVAIDHLSDGRLTLGVGLGDPPDVEYTTFGENSDPVVRGEKLDEALDIITGLWTGNEFSYHGRHYHVNKARFRPIPKQQPRIPIWVGGSWPNRIPFRRASRWDGVIPVKDYATINLEPHHLQEINSYVEKHRTLKTGFDTVIIGNGKSQGDIENRRRQYEQLGITWWLKYLPSYRNSPTEIKEQIRAGPPIN